MTTAVLSDLTGQRTLCAYTLRGFDPYPLIGVDPPALNDIGVIPKDFGTALFILPATVMLSMWYGNAGGGVSCLLIIGCVICDRRPFLTGVLLSLAMIKPQVALTFCILFLLQRRFKVLLTAAAECFRASFDFSSSTIR